MEPIVNSTRKVPKDPLDRAQVRLPEIMHVKIDLLDMIHNIMLGEGEILKSIAKVVVGSVVTNRGIVTIDLGLHVHRCRTSLATQHVSAL
jgi:hypothetical protein